MRFVGYAALILAIAGLISRLVPVSNVALFMAAALSMYLMAAAAVAAAIFALTRRRVLCLTAVAVCVAALVSAQPIAVDTPVTQGPLVRLLTANLTLGRADVGELARWAVGNADVAALQEVTPDLADELARSPWAAVFPFRLVDARDGAAGLGLYSRTPLVPRGLTATMVTAEVAVRGGAAMTVSSLRLPNPLSGGLDGWHTGLADVRAAIGDAGDGCTVLAGDYNATAGMREFRSLLVDGFADAATQSGDRVVATFPSINQLPPLIAIDHVLLRGCVAASARTVSVMRSDHRGLVVTIGRH